MVVVVVVVGVAVVGVAAAAGGAEQACCSAATAAVDRNRAAFSIAHHVPNSPCRNLGVGVLVHLRRSVAACCYAIRDASATLG